MNDERISWVKEKPGRKVVQTIEKMPTGFSVTTQWVENGDIFRQDCEVAIQDMPPISGGAGKMG